MVVFPLLARLAPVPTKYHTIAGILGATVTLCRQPLPAARPHPFLRALPFTRRASKLRREQPLHAPMLDSTQFVPPPVGPSCDLLPARWRHAQRALPYFRYSRRH